MCKYASCGNRAFGARLTGAPVCVLYRFNSKGQKQRAIQLLSRLVLLHKANPHAPIRPEDVVGPTGVQVGAGVLPLSAADDGKDHRAYAGEGGQIRGQAVGSGANASRPQPQLATAR